MFIGSLLNVYQAAPEAIMTPLSMLFAICQAHVVRLMATNSSTDPVRMTKLTCAHIFIAAWFYIYVIWKLVDKDHDHLIVVLVATGSSFVSIVIYYYWQSIVKAVGTFLRALIFWKKG